MEGTQVSVNIFRMHEEFFPPIHTRFSLSNLIWFLLDFSVFISTIEFFVFYLPFKINCIENEVEKNAAFRGSKKILWLNCYSDNKCKVAQYSSDGRKKNYDFQKIS
jgi:hypothetical protein